MRVVEFPKTTNPKPVRSSSFVAFLVQSKVSGTFDCINVWYNI